MIYYFSDNFGEFCVFKGLISFEQVIFESPKFLKVVIYPNVLKSRNSLFNVDLPTPVYLTTFDNQNHQSPVEELCRVFGNIPEHYFGFVSIFNTIWYYQQKHLILDLSDLF